MGVFKIMKNMRVFFIVFFLTFGIGNNLNSMDSKAKAIIVRDAFLSRSKERKILGKTKTVSGYKTFRKKLRNQDSDVLFVSHGKVTKSVSQEYYNRPRFFCEVEGCGRVYAWGSHFQRHQTAHRNGRVLSKTKKTKRKITHKSFNF